MLWSSKVLSSSKWLIYCTFLDFEIWNITVMCDDLFVGKISLNITKNISVNIWGKYPDFYHNFWRLFGLLNWAQQRKHWQWDNFWIIFTNVPVFRASLITIACMEIITLENWNLQARFCVPGLKEELSYVSNL